MEHFIRIAFWIVALGACLPQANPAPLIEIADWNMKLFQEVNCADSKFYTPTDVKNECFISALNCIIRELNGTAMPECTDNNKRILQGIDTLGKAISDLKEQKEQTANDSTDCDCHRWPPRPFDDFVKSIRSLLQKINSDV